VRDDVANGERCSDQQGFQASIRCWRIEVSCPNVQKRGSDESNHVSAREKDSDQAAGIAGRQAGRVVSLKGRAADFACFTGQHDVVLRHEAHQPAVVGQFVLLACDQTNRIRQPLATIFEVFGQARQKSL
jgi:hypothetical protein